LSYYCTLSTHNYRSLLSEFIAKYGKPFGKTARISLFVNIVTLTLFSGLVLFFAKWLRFLKCVISFLNQSFSPYFFSTHEKIFLDVTKRNKFKNTPLENFDGLDLLENKKMKSRRTFNLRSTEIFGPEDIQLQIVVGNFSLDAIRTLNNASWYTETLTDLSGFCNIVYQFLRPVVVTKHSIEHVELKMKNNFCEKPYFLGEKTQNLRWIWKIWSINILARSFTMGKVNILHIKLVGWFRKLEWTVEQFSRVSKAS